ncbi:hypothetical protein ABIB40_002913 [Pedobacter sp. UYP30]|uniref:galactosyltransferase-related protein n=1 Tax=Pedobacter sp. UYP30 TaxID=1756400 RepID=UPI003397D5E6
MIFISAQPDQYYFLWQLELLIFNFRRLGISANDIHILIGYDPQSGPSQEFRKFKKKYVDININEYQDSRISKKYLSSIRPHILAKHFKKYPKLQNEPLFYHDSDIVFSRLPDFSDLLDDDIWYASETAEYTNMNYIIQNSSNEFFLDMCRILEVDPKKVEEQDKNAGGAQYLLKDCSVNFWEKIEVSCEKLFEFLNESKLKKGFCNTTSIVSPWYSDMWVLWWSAIAEERKFKIASQLDFSWATSPVSEWDTKAILHYTGSVMSDNEKIFRKASFSSCSPFFSSFSNIDQNTCSYPLVQLISEFKRTCTEQRRILVDISFLIIVRIDSIDRLENTFAVTNYLCNNFKTNVILMEVDSKQHIDLKKIHPDVKYIYQFDENPKLHRTKYNNKLIKQCDTSFIALYDIDVVLPIDQIVKSVELLRQGNYKIVFPFDGRCLSVDILLKAMFIKIMDEEFLSSNYDKQTIYSRRAVGGCIFLDRMCYVNSGGENQNITSWGPDDVERFKRMKILGHKYKRIQGVLYHLHHSRKENSGYQSNLDNIILMEEYLKICEFKRSDLEEYVKTWAWITV